MEVSVVATSVSDPHRWIAWSPNGTMLASASDETLKILPIDVDPKGTLAETQIGSHLGKLEQCCWNPQSNTTVATVSMDKPAAVWDVRTKSRAMTLNVPPKNKNIDWSYDGNYIAMIDTENYVQILDVRTNTAVKEPQVAGNKQKADINQICWQPNSEALFIPQPNNLMCALRWEDLTSERNVIKVNVKSSAYILTSMAFDPFGRRFAIGGSDGIVSLCDREDFACIRCFGRFDASVVTSMSFDSTGEYICASYINRSQSDKSSDMTERYFDITHVETGDLMQFKIEKSKPQSICAWNPKGPLIAIVPTHGKGSIEIMKINPR